MRELLRSQWRALIDAEITREQATAWAQLQLTTESWTDEVTHRGLQLINDRVHDGWSTVDDDVRAELLAIYGCWMDDVRSFEEDPATWKRIYAVNVVRGLPVPMRLRAIDDFRASGYLAPGDDVEFRLDA